MLKFSEIFEFSKEKFRKIPILKEFEWFVWFEWFGPSPIEPFNSARDDARIEVESERRIRRDNHAIHVVRPRPSFPRGWSATLWIGVRSPRYLLPKTPPSASPLFPFWERGKEGCLL